MKQAHTAAVKHDSADWIGWIAEVPGVNCQDATRAELLASPKATLADALAFSLAEARRAAGDDYEELPVAV